jgi:hypothetical protein
MSRVSRSIVFSFTSTLLLAIVPKCPLCWIALLSLLGVSWPIDSSGLRAMVILLTLVPLGLLLVFTHRSRNYSPLLVGIIAAVALYAFKFRLRLDVGAYISSAALFGATVWSAKLRASRPCCCSPLATEKPTTNLCAHSSEVLDG